MDSHDCDVLIIGAGPAGLYAAYYAGFRGWSVVVLDALPEAGGQITALYPEKEILDVPGHPTIRGRVLIDNLLAAAAPYHPVYLLGEQAVGLSTSAEGPVRVTAASGTTVTARAAVVTGGIGSFTPRPLPAGDGWVGRGLVYFVPRLADHADRDVVIVGGGDSAVDWAHSLQPLARSVTLIHRREQFRAHASMVDTVRRAGVRLMTSCEVSAIRGGGDPPWLSQVEVTHRITRERTVLPAQSVVAALGFVANIGPMTAWGMELERRHIQVDTTMATSLPRVFAAGDIVTYAGKVPLISVGFGEAALAVNNAAPFVDPSMGIFPGHSSGGAAE